MKIRIHTASSLEIRNVPDIYLPLRDDGRYEYTTGLISHAVNTKELFHKSRGMVGEIDVQWSKENGFYISHDEVNAPVSYGLREALEDWDQMGLQVILDCKPSTYNHVNELLEEIDARYEKKGDVAVSAQCLNFLAQLRHLSKSLELGWVCHHYPFKDWTPFCLQILQMLEIRFVSLNKDFSSCARAVQKEGFQVYLYTINGIYEWEQYRRDKSVTAIFTDHA